MPTFLSPRKRPAVSEGLAACQRRGLGDLLPWLWAVNGAASVIGSVLALVIAIFNGITAALFVAVLCYTGAYIVFRRIAAPDVKPQKTETEARQLVGSAH